MAFPLYLSYLTSEQKPATACFVPAQPVVGTATAASTGTARPASGTGTGGGLTQINKTMDGASVVPMDCYEDMFHEIAKKLYGEGAIVQPGSEQQNGGTGQGGQQQNQQNNTQSELGLMDLDYQQVGKDGHYQTQGTTGPTLIVQTTGGGPLLQLTMAETVPHTPATSTLTTPTPAKKPKMSAKLKKAAAAAVALAAAEAAAAATAAIELANKQSAEQEAAAAAASTWVESEELLPWNTTTRVASYNATHKLFRCLDCGCVGFLARIAEHWLGAHANLRVFQCPRCHYNSAWARCIRMHLARQHNEPNPPDNGCSLWKENPVLEEVTKYLLRLKNRVENKDELPSPTGSSVGGGGGSISGGGGSDKRYSCPFCPYATDRRDLYTRHETIHSEEKPFQCFICDKQFNRADHCKKHFSRMHRETAYDLQKIKKTAAERVSREAAGNINISTTGTAVVSKQHQMVQQQTTAPTPTTALVVTPSQVPFYTTLAVQQQQQHHHHHQPQQQQQQQQQLQSRPVTVPASIVTATYPSHLNLPAFPSQPAPTQAYKSYTTLGVEALVRPTTTVTAPTTHQQSSSHTSSSSLSGGEKKKKEKLYACTYCAWRGVDNWCLKRHLNTHIKPYLCVLCDYKAARSERLATHVHKVHNKRICSKCNFLADDQDALSQHMREHQVGVK